MPNTCSTGCCSTNVPVRDSSHASCHCQDTHLCESPVLKKGISNCNDGCCSTSTISVSNSDEVRQYVDALRCEHNGHSEFDAGRMLIDISKSKITANCCPPIRQDRCKEPDFSITSSGCSISSYTGSQRKRVDHYLGLKTNTDACNSCEPTMYYEDLNCSTASGVSCCSSSDRSYVYRLANRVRGNLDHYCHTYGDIRETIKEIPAADVFLVNHEFIDLLIDEILGCLPIGNLSQNVVKRVKQYVELYYIYYRDLDEIGNLVLNAVIPISDDLITSDEEKGRVKAVLTALSDRLLGKVYEYEQ